MPVPTERGSDSPVRIASATSARPSTPDQADIKVANKWSNVVLTFVISRKLVTGSKFDVQFSDLGGKYPFGFAAFDNAQVRHAVHFNPLYLTFAR